MDDVISLGISEPDFVTPTAIRRAGIHSVEEGQTGYTCNAGLWELRQEVVRHLIVKGLNEIGLPCFEPHGAFYGSSWTATR